MAGAVPHASTRARHLIAIDQTTVKRVLSPRLRYSQRKGKDAPGGAYDYVIGSHMRSGFALVAWPIRYGEVSIASFMINHAGLLYQKDLRAVGAAIARQMTTFNPDATWTRLDGP